MAGLTPFLATRTGRLVARLLPDTLFGRLALLLSVAVLSSHILALTLMFELRPHPERPPSRPPHLLQAGLLLDIGVRLSALMLAGWIGARWLSQPMRRLASAAREIGLDVHRPPLAEDGTEECREATRVFNQMQAQICQQLGERDRLVAAVSHDLRTPLTRLALRAEGLADAEQRRCFSQDIVEMDSMITATLDYLRGAAEPERFVPLDINSMLESLADDQQACGNEVTVRGSAAPLQAQASSLRRCIENLVQNAVRYGEAAHIEVADSAQLLRVEVRDRGTGIPEHELDKVLAPFYRLEGSRNRNSGGVGLGLSIAQDIARRHQGQLQLRNGQYGGLVATLLLPRAPLVAMA